MFLAALLLCAVGFAESKTLAVQICLDREGFSVNTIDGQWGDKSKKALAKFCADQSIPVPATPEAAYDEIFSGAAEHLFTECEVTAADLAAIVAIPDTPEGKAALTHMGYQSLQEMFAERGHLSEKSVARLNPHITNWHAVKVGTKIRIPAFSSIQEDLSSWQRRSNSTEPMPTATLLRISLSHFMISAYDSKGHCLLSLPCSIAKNKSKIPQRRDLKIVTQIPNPNYTYTPDYTPPGKKAMRYVFPAGPRCPVGVAWLGLDLPGYGIHGTPKPKSIGRAESHGCFRLSNWNVARLFAICQPGTKVIIED